MNNDMPNFTEQDKKRLKEAKQTMELEQGREITWTEFFDFINERPRLEVVK